MSQLAKSTQYLVISLVGADHIGATTTLTALCLKTGANITDSRMTKMGSEYTITALISGNWGSLAKVEAGIPNLSKENNFEYLLRRTEFALTDENVIQYTVQITTIDKPGIVHSLAKFFRDQEIHIDEITTETYIASRTNTTMFRLSMIVDIPEGLSIMHLREQFLTYCENKNLDAILIEPQKY